MIPLTDKNELRSEYKHSDFPGGLVRGKYAKRLKESSNSRPQAGGCSGFPE